MGRLTRFFRHNRIVLFFRLSYEAFCEVCSLVRYLGASAMERDEVKYRADLQIRSHAIEKGLSIGACRAGFGKAKMQELLDELEQYCRLYPASTFVDEVLGIVARYLEYNKSQGVDVASIEIRYEALLQGRRVCQDTGIITMYRSETQKVTQAEFKTFFKSRYSVRDFDTSTDAVIDIQRILSAIDLSRKAPSACNRQPAKVHIYSGAKAQQLFDFQGGCKGFSRDMQYALLVTADMRRYFFNERHQMYVDGGLFAMDLLLALHYEGIATIPLTTAFKRGKEAQLHALYDIPKNEIPVLIIGVGGYKEQYKVAVSHRNDVAEYYEVHN